MVAIASCGSHKSPRPDLPTQVGKTYEQAKKTALATRGIGDVFAYSETGKLDSDEDAWFVCTQSLDPPSEDSDSYSVGFGLVPERADCPGGELRPGLEEEAETEEEAEGVRTLEGLKVLDGLRPDPYDYDTSGDIPDVLRGAEDEDEVARALGLADAERLYGYCAPANPDRFSVDRHGLNCRVGKGEYGTLVFRPQPLADGLNEGAYGLQAWLCCESAYDIDGVIGEDDDL